MSYSEDLRERVVKFVEEGGSKAKASRQFNVSRWCVYDWLGRKDLKAKKTGPKKPRKLNLEALRNLVSEKPDAYLEELAQTLNVGKTTVWSGCRKLGFSRKKNQSLQRTKRKRA